MRIQFHGAAGGVTGCCHLLSTDRARVLLDFGLHQGGPHDDELNRRLPAFDAPRLDAVVLSHAHIDHCGRLPLLPGLQCRAPIWCTPATRELCGIQLPDSANQQAHDREHTAGGRTTGQRTADERRPPPPPLYDQDDVARVLEQFSPLPYHRTQEIAEGVRLTFHDAGHILGSCIVALDVEERGRRARLVFTGDVGNWPVPLLRDPEFLDSADVLLLESTYGDRNHRTREATLEELTGVLDAARRRAGKVLMPSFAVGRTQELIYHFGALSRANHLGLPVFVDSPMAVSVTELYRRHVELLDDEAHALLQRGDRPLDFPGLHLTRTTEESMALNTRPGAAVIIASSGMCTGGRIVHHLRHHAGDPDTQIVIVGYQAERTPGRALVDGARSIVVLGHPVRVAASVHTLGGLSAHADQQRLMTWAGKFRAARPRTFLVHGEDGARKALAARLRGELGLDVTLPVVGDAAEF